MLAVPLSLLGAEKIDFTRDVRPILSDRCFSCHGPDKAQRLSGLRFDIEQDAFAELAGGGRAIVPGKPEASALIERISSADPARRMPPAAMGHDPLTDEQIATLTAWVREGAAWERHWAFLPPRKAPAPATDSAGGRHAIDRFILARLEQEGLPPAAPAERRTLIRRAALDLTGLPPAPEDVRAFVDDRSPDAYEKVLDRLLASPRYAERMAYRWLDAARYADTNGYQNDRPRYMWRWRDWVIEAFDGNMPFDRFTVEQLAGDLLPNPTLAQRIATGFNRNHRGNAENGTDPDEYQVEYAVDRVETTATVWLGLTMGCARCHDHKYDPVTQKEFYEFYAYFNNVSDRGRYFKYGNTPPLVRAPTEAQQEQLDALDARIHEAAQRLTALEDAGAQGIASVAPEQFPAWIFDERMAARRAFDGAGRGAGKIGRAAYLDGERHYDLGDVGDYDFYDPLHPFRLDQARSRDGRHRRALSAHAEGLRPFPDRRQAAIAHRHREHLRPHEDRIARRDSVEPLDPRRRRLRRRAHDRRHDALHRRPARRGPHVDRRIAQPHAGGGAAAHRLRPRKKRPLPRLDRRRGAALFPRTRRGANRRARNRGNARADRRARSRRTQRGARTQAPLGIPEHNGRPARQGRLGRLATPAPGAGKTSSRRCRP